MPSRRTVKYAQAACVTAGILYNSWPLGYWLNSRVGTYGLASELQAAGQPYDWLFVLLDVLSGGLAAAALFVLAAYYWPRMNWRVRTSGLALLLFGLTTILAAVLPMSCAPSVHSCPALAHDMVYRLHGDVSFLNGIAVMVSIGLLLGRPLHREWRTGWWLAVGGLAVITLAAAASGLHLISVNTLQYGFIVYCGLWLAMYTTAVDRLGGRLVVKKQPC